MPKDTINMKHILVVEDDEDIQGMISYNLEKSGYRVTALNSGHVPARSPMQVASPVVVGSTR